MKKQSLKRKYPKHLSNRIVAFCVMLIVILCTGITYISYRMYQEDMMDEYKKYESSMLNIALSGANAEGIQEAIETKTKNESYQQLSKQFNLIMNHSDIEYIYALYFTEGDDNMYYVLNGYTEEQKRQNPTGIHGLGELPLEGDFAPNMVKELRKAFEQGKDEIGYIYETDAQNTYLLTTYYPLQNAEGEVVCIFCVDIAMKDVYEKLQNFIWTVIIGVILLGVVFLSIFIVIMHKQLVIPIKLLADSAKHYIRQQDKCEPECLEFKEVPIHSRDELELLSDSLKYMVEQSKEYMIHLSNYAAEQERVNAQYAIVQQLKENLFPFQFPVFQERVDFDMCAKIQYSKVNSGDFYNFFLIDSNHLCFFLGTASGSGVTTTMIAMITTIYLENYARLGYTPSRILGETNNRISENNSGEITVDTFLGIVDLQTGKFHYAQVGNTAALMKRSGCEIEELGGPSGFSLGAMENVVFPEMSMYLTQGEVLFLYSRGVSAKKDKRENEFTDDYVKKAVHEQLQLEYDLEEIMKHMEETLDAYGEGTDREADETMLMFRYNG